jgi:hypothetical protein
MERWLTRLIGIAMVLGLALGLAPVQAQTMIHVLEQVGQNGSVDWTTGVVTAVGQGAAPPNAANAAQARAMAERAAVVVAYRNLLEVVQGVRVDSATLVENMVLSSDVIKSQVSGFVKGAQVIKKETAPDGLVEVTVAMRLNGDFSNLVLPKTRPAPPIAAQAPAGGGRSFTAQPRSPVPVAPGGPAAGTVYTGLIVDARGVGVRPAMAPKIRNEEGREVYGSAFVGREYAVEQGMMGYIKDLPAAQSNPRVTERPFVVKALKADGPNKTDLVISNADAQTLHGMKENLTFLEKARVMVVLD